LANKENHKHSHVTIRRDIKHPRIEFRTGNLILILPKNYKNKEKLLQRHKKWIQQKKSSITLTKKIVKGKKLPQPINKKEFEIFVQEKTKEFCKKLDTRIEKIFIRKMCTKWGSCSQNRNLTINSLLAYLPKQIIEYVVFHEIVHTKERKHNETFWNIVEQKYPNHQKIENELFGYWFLLQKKLFPRIRKIEKLYQKLDSTGENFGSKIKPKKVRISMDQSHLIRTIDEPFLY